MSNWFNDWNQYEIWIISCLLTRKKISSVRRQAEWTFAVFSRTSVNNDFYKCCLFDCAQICLGKQQIFKFRLYTLEFLLLLSRDLCRIINRTFHEKNEAIHLACLVHVGVQPKGSPWTHHKGMNVSGETRSGTTLPSLTGFLSGSEPSNFASGGPGVQVET